MHFEGYVSVATLAAVLWVLAEVRLKNWKLEKLWKWYESVHGMNGHSVDRVENRN